MRTSGCARGYRGAAGRPARWRPRGSRRIPRAWRRGSSPAPLADAAQLEDVLLHAIPRGAADLAQRALEDAGMEFARAAALGADDGVMAASLLLRAGTHRGGPDDAVEQAELQERGEVPVDGDAVHPEARAGENRLQLARPERARRRLDQLEERAPGAGDAAAAAPQRRLGASGKAHAGVVAQMQPCCIKRRGLKRGWRCPG